MSNISKSIIDNLTPGQQALLHGALVYFKEHIETALAHHTLSDGPVLYRRFFDYSEKEVKELIAVLFADTFIDQENFIKEFNDYHIVRYGKKTETTHNKPAA